MLEARELLCERDERTLFSGLSFTLNAGEWVQITGSNGAGDDDGDTSGIGQEKEEG